MPNQFTSKEFWELFEHLPKKLQKTIISKQTNDYVWEICEKNNLNVDIAKFNRLVGNVLMGLIPPNEFEKVLEKELELKTEIAKKTGFAVHRFIFSPVSRELSNLYGSEIKELDVKLPKDKLRDRQTKKPIFKNDTYREIVE
ncbi:MAG: hypothetical protein ISS87_00635 [Candidatus Pacebacteria bacterium]|nr:hypothetical protein [Candidatus Paceibacterota bacterium]